MKCILVIALVCSLGIAVNASPFRSSGRSTVLRFVDLFSRILAKPKPVGTPWPPAFCNRLQCPRYTLKANKTGYEIREYAASEWVTTSMKGMDYGEAMTPMFMRLFRYISGANAASRKIPMTAPVIVRLLPGQGPACESNFNMSFYVPTGSNPPQPTDKAVSLADMPKMTVYVRSFGGYAMTYDTWQKEALELQKAINDQSKYHTDFWYTAGYNAPFQIFNRHNEVWFIGK